MRTKIVLEVDGINLFDARGIIVGIMNGIIPTPFSTVEDMSKTTIELVKLGLSAEEIIKLKNQGLLS